jgi:hypothetical protein
LSSDPEETDATSLIQPMKNGGAVIPRSPARQVFAKLWYPNLMDPTLHGGISFHVPARLDVLFREDGTAGKDRDLRAQSIRDTQPAGALQDIEATDHYLDQIKSLATDAEKAGDITSAEHDQLISLLQDVKFWHKKYRDGQYHDTALLNSAAAFGEIEALMMH